MFKLAPVFGELQHLRFGEDGILATRSCLGRLSDGMLEVKSKACTEMLTIDDLVTTRQMNILV